VHTWNSTYENSWFFQRPLKRPQAAQNCGVIPSGSVQNWFGWSARFEIRAASSVDCGFVPPNLYEKAQHSKDICGFIFVLFNTAGGLVCRLVSVSPRADFNGCWWCSSWVVDALTRWSLTSSCISRCSWCPSPLLACRRVDSRPLFPPWTSKEVGLAGLGKLNRSQTRVNRCFALQDNAFRDNGTRGCCSGTSPVSLGSTGQRLLNHKSIDRTFFAAGPAQSSNAHWA